MKVKTFDHATFSDIQTDLTIKLKEVAKQYGINLRVTKAKYGPLEGLFIVKASVVGSDGQIKSQEEEDFKKYCEDFGLKQDDLGKRFTVGGKGYTIIGLLPSRRKYPILTRTDRGRRIIHPTHQVIMALKSKAETVTQGDEE